MKRLPRLLATLLIAIAPSTLIHAQERVFTLDECIYIALSENPTVKVADLEVVKVRYSRQETMAALLPNVSFSGQYNRTLKKQVAYMNLGAFGGDQEQEGSTEESGESRGDKGFEMGLDNSYSMGFSASMPLIAPQMWASMKLSDVEIESAVEKSRASRLDMVNQVKNAYYALLFAIDSKRTVQQSYDMARTTYESYVNRQAVGDASEYDVLRASVAMQNIEPELYQCEIAIRQARLQLAILMGMDVNTPFTIAGDLEQFSADMYEQALSLQADLTNNTQLIQNQIQTRQLRQTLSYQRAAWYPTLSITGNYMWNSSSNGSPFSNFRWTPYSVVGLQLTIPLYTGGARYSRVRQAQVALDQMEFTREDLTRSLTSQAVLAIDNINLNVKQVASSQLSVDQAERAHNIQQQSFEIGATTYLDLRDSELSLTRARLSYLQAIYNYLVANSNLELLLGNAPIEQYTNLEK
ncbi:MAG: TolC family protein [Muribaculaceae bacterium]